MNNKHDADHLLFHRLKLYGCSQRHAEMENFDKLGDISKKKKGFIIIIKQQSIII